MNGKKFQVTNKLEKCEIWCAYGKPSRSPKSTQKYLVSSLKWVKTLGKSQKTSKTEKTEARNLFSTPMPIAHPTGNYSASKIQEKKSKVSPFLARTYPFLQVHKTFFL